MERAAVRVAPMVAETEERRVAEGLHQETLTYLQRCLVNDYT